MRLLLDTHVLLWAIADDPRLTRAGRNLLASAEQRFISAASCFEIATKTRLGKLRGGGAVLTAWSRYLGNLQAHDLSLSATHMSRAGSLMWEHRDPFDRMLVAQAQTDALTIVTADGAIRNFGEVASVWPDE